MSTTRLRGIWLPLVTPFREGVLDETSVERMVRHYLAARLDAERVRRDRGSIVRPA